MDWHYLVVMILSAPALGFFGNPEVLAKQRGKRLAFFQHSKCTYSNEVAEVALHFARGSKSTDSNGYQLHVHVSSLTL